jgi:hypothetical protein
MNETQRTQLDVLNQKVVDGEELNELQKQLRSELSALQQHTGNSFADLAAYSILCRKYVIFGLTLPILI